YFFFFFQAEDGIRDLIVTGVQTCALPIYLRQPERPGEPDVAARGRPRRPGTGRDLRALPESPRAVAESGHQALGRRAADAGHRRSEERRVGKEWRSRWSGET